MHTKTASYKLVILQSIKFTYCNILAEGFHFIYLAFRFSQDENLSLSAWVS